MTPLLDVRDLKIEFKTETGSFMAMGGVSFTVNRGRTLGIVGESGCGKSVTSLGIMGLIPTPPGRYVGGEVLFEGRDLLRMPKPERRALRGGRMGMVFQEPMTSLNPVYTVGAQIIECLRAHGMTNRREARERAIKLLDLVRLPSPGKRVDDFPHQLSGGQRQRVMIALALANNPDLLIADEPTTALDVSVQAQIVNLMQDLQRDFGMAYVFISHDLSVVRHIADRVAVMYLGRIVEEAPAETLFADPRHPYTRALIQAAPRPVPGLRAATEPPRGEAPSALPAIMRIKGQIWYLRPHHRPRLHWRRDWRLWPMRAGQRPRNHPAAPCHLAHL